ncbi:hypothetical protein E3N88_15149 [Mikania micrantha]|uniref:Uncharacterized protein n=1 Tax=Mikania micrantha TaxID=192012 RepID=A0A5N6NUT5_9ASTR|nr:hypothetical protein E3N88_15149 [Mikania micrantha]
MKPIEDKVQKKKILVGKGWTTMTIKRRLKNSNGTTHYTLTLSIFLHTQSLSSSRTGPYSHAGFATTGDPSCGEANGVLCENMDETGNAEDRLRDSPVIADMIELTPEGVRDNFHRLQELVNNYIREERLRGVRVRLAYEGDSSLPLTPPHPNNSNLQTSFSPQISTATNAITLVPTQIPEASTQTFLGLLEGVITEPPRAEITPFSICLSSQSMPHNNLYANPFATYSVPLPHIPANTGYAGDQYYGTATAQLGVQSMAQQFWQNPYWQPYPYSGYPGYSLAEIPHTQTQSFGIPSFVTPAVTQPIAQPIFHTEDLSQPYVPTTHTKFSARIANFAFPPKTKMPANIKTYDGLGDPDDHLELFSDAATVESTQTLSHENHVVRQKGEQKSNTHEMGIPRGPALSYSCRRGELLISTKLHGIRH